MSVTVILGAQWGDEGKGKAVDFFARDFDFVARYNGGNNAGHTVINERGEFKIHLVPSGIFYPRVQCLVGGGVVIDPAVLIEEIETLRAAHIRIGKRLLISPRAHLIMPYHKILDGLYEQAKGAGATGTTRRGIGPAFADKVSYNGLRWSDVADEKLFAEKLRVQVELKNKIIVALGGQPLAFEKIFADYRGYYEMLKPHIVEIFPVIQRALAANKKILLEQAQGSLLDPDWGTYPFVTGSTTLASAATGGLGIPPRELKRIVGVAKAYTTRVGAGALPTEVMDDANPARRALQEIAATTGRTRRGGWFDAEVVRFSSQVNGTTELFLTKLDILSQFDAIKICVGYEFEGKRAHYHDLNAYQLDQVKPIYRTMRGWRADISRVRKFSDLPARARAYVETIEKLVGVPVKWISVGPERDATIKR
jgi:adenylosuccinate synthase